MACCFLECSLILPTHDDLEKDRLAEEPLLDYENEVDYRKLKCTLSIARFLSSLRKLRRWVHNAITSKGCRKCWCRTLIIILILLLGTFILLFVIFPLTFKNSVEIQRSLIFHPVNNPHNHYDSFGESYCSNTQLNNTFFSMKGLRLGLWNVSHRYSRWYNGPYRFNSGINIKPTLLYFHMENGDRRSSSYLYCTFGGYFNIITFDYRSYGDSSTLDLTESALVDDSVHLYKWVMNQSQADIYVWGDTLGAAIATHVVSRLHSEKIVPTGLILENPFTTLSEKVSTWYYPLGKIFSWMPWYDTFVTKPLMENDLSFKTSEYIMNVNCPILIWKREYQTGGELTEKLALIAAEHDSSTQGSLTLNSVWWTSSTFTHSYPYEMNDFVTDCLRFKRNTTDI